MSRRIDFLHKLLTSRGSHSELQCCWFGSYCLLFISSESHWYHRHYCSNPYLGCTRTRTLLYNSICTERSVYLRYGLRVIKQRVTHETGGSSNVKTPTWQVPEEAPGMAYLIPGMAYPGVVYDKNASLPTTSTSAVSYCVTLYPGIAEVIRSFGIALYVANIHELPGPTIEARCIN